MRNRFLGSIGGLLAVAGLVFGQSPRETTPPVASPEADVKAAPTAKTEAAPAAASDWTGLGIFSQEDASPPAGGFCTFSAEFLLWFVKNTRFIGPVASNDILGIPGSAPLFGTTRISYSKNPLAGFRLTGGYYFMDNPPVKAGEFSRDAGVEVSYFSTGQNTRGFSNDTAVVTVRPFFDLNNRTESALVVGVPGLATGLFSVTNTFGGWQGAEANVWKNVFDEYFATCSRLDLIAGLRYLEFGEDFAFDSISLYNQNLPANSPFRPFAGDRIVVSDLFATRNRFYGSQIGTNWKTYLGPMNLNFTGKLATGWTIAEINIQGAQLRTTNTGVQTVSQGGLLALSSNIGRFRRTSFTWVPELDVNGTIPVTENINITMGYTFLLMSRVFRPGLQIDRGIDVTKIPNFPSSGATPLGFDRPAVPFKDTNTWMMGFNIGLLINW